MIGNSPPVAKAAGISHNKTLYFCFKFNYLHWLFTNFNTFFQTTNLFLSLNMDLNVKKYEGLDLESHVLLSALDGEDWLTASSGRFTPAERTPLH